jgi:hypothetical protein
MRIQLLCYLSLVLMASGCSTYSSEGYTRVARVTIVNTPASVTSEVKCTAVVDKAWDYGHVPWYYFWAIANVAPTRYTRHVDLRLVVPPDQVGVGNELRIMQTERPIALRRPPAKGLFLLEAGDEVLLGLNKPQIDKRTRVVVCPMSRP